MAPRSRQIGAVFSAGLVLLFGVAAAATPSDPPLTLKQRQQMRFPQPVRVGDLKGEDVVEAGARHRKLGVVVGVFRPSGGDLQLVFRYGGVFGLGARTIAPELDEVDLVGPMVKIIDLDRMDLAALPTFTGAGGTFLSPNSVIRLGVDRKY
jgi:hypothetical protein